MKHTTSLKIARHGAKLFLGLAAMLVYLYVFSKFDLLRWVAGGVLFYAGMMAYPPVERFFEETFEVVEQ